MADLRRLLLALVVFGSLGLTGELLLQEHWEDLYQAVPLAALAASLAAAVALWVRPTPGTVRIFRLVMALGVVVGLAGLALHFNGNLAFEQEMEPDASGPSLWWAALRGGVPALAPGSMVQLGLLGLALTYRHPALSRYDMDPASGSPGGSHEEDP